MPEPCTESCTLRGSCPRCKGKPVMDLHKRIRRALGADRALAAGEAESTGYDLAAQAVIAVLEGRS